MEYTLKPAQYLGVATLDRSEEIERYEKHWSLIPLYNRGTHPSSHHSLDDLTWFVVSDSGDVVKTYYLEGKWKDCLDWCRKVGESTAYYLLGDWKEKQPHDDGSINAAAWFESKPTKTWAMYFENGIGWAAVGECWEVIDELLRFPTEKILADDDGMAIRNFYVGLARWWNDEHDLSWVDQVKETRGAGSKGAHLLCDVATAIVQRDAKATAAALKKYVQWFLKGRDHQGQFPMNGTFLWHVARRRRLALELPEEVDKFLFRLPDGF